MELIPYICHQEQNTYVTLDFANTYIATYKNLQPDSAWLNLTNDLKIYSLILSTYALNTLPYKGKKFFVGQKVAFPRLRYIKDKSYSLLDDCLDDATIVYSGSIDISDLSTITLNSSTLSLRKYDIIYIPENYVNYKYLTVKKIYGNIITVYEPTLSENISGSVWLTPILGIEDNVRYAQIELAVTYISEILYQNKGTDPTQMIRSINMGGAMSVSYFKSYAKEKFGLNTSTIIDIVYYLLSSWLTSLGGRIV